MFRKEVEKLLRSQQEPIISLLKARGLVELSKPGVRKWSNIVLTRKGKGEAGISDILITDEYIEDLRSFFPPPLRGNSSVIRSKLNDLILEHDLDMNVIMEATKQWVADKGETYCGNINNFIWKMDGDIQTSRLLEYYEFVSNADERRVSVPTISRPQE